MIVLVLEYRITDREGRVLGNSRFQGPLKLRIGSGEVWPELEEKLRDMKPGEEKEFWIRVPYDERKIKRIPRHLIPGDLKEGEEFLLKTPAGEWTARLRGFEGEEALVDFNPPSAGEEVHYWVKAIYREDLGDSI